MQPEQKRLNEAAGWVKKHAFRLFDTNKRWQFLINTSVVNDVVIDRDHKVMYFRQIPDEQNALLLFLIKQIVKAVHHDGWEGQARLARAAQRIRRMGKTELSRAVWKEVEAREDACGVLANAQKSPRYNAVVMEEIEAKKELASA